MSLRTLGRTSAGLLLSFSLVAFGAGAAQAQDGFVVHGIFGTDLGIPGLDEDLPVDIAVNGACALQGVTFSAIAPVSYDIGPSEIEIFLSDADEPLDCTGVRAVTGRIDVAAGESPVVVAHIDVNGAAKLTKFSIDRSELDDGLRLAVAHAAAAPAVDVRAKGYRPYKRIKIEGLRNGEQSFPLEGRAQTYRVEVRNSATSKRLFGPVRLPLAGNLLLIAVGSDKTDSFDVLVLDPDSF